MVGFFIKERAITQATHYIPLTESIYIKVVATTPPTQLPHGATTGYIMDIVFIHPTFYIV